MLRATMPVNSERRPFLVIGKSGAVADSRGRWIRFTQESDAVALAALLNQTGKTDQYTVWYELEA